MQTINNTIFGLLILLTFLSCKESNNNKTKAPYVIVQNVIVQKKLINVRTPPPLLKQFFYGNKVFIITPDSTIYFYQTKQKGFICGTGFENSQIPEFINLQTEDLVQIPLKNISEFVALNLTKNQSKSFENRNIIDIASQIDTLNFSCFFELKCAVEKKIVGRDLFIIRKTTQEEDTVLKYKRNCDYYYSKDIKWDKTKISVLK
jgi:hypothetical protein